jgi:hypothetical protein
VSGELVLLGLCGAACGAALIVWLFSPPQPPRW